jgi:hypothetical protein
MHRTISRSLRDEALSLLEHRGSLLDVAREVSQMLQRGGVHGAIIGGIAVVLHGYVRSTTDVDVLVDEPLTIIADLLKAEGFQYNRARREFVRGEIPVHLVTCEQVGKIPEKTIEIDGIMTVELASLIEMKLASGSKNILRAIDLADVIGLIRQNSLTGEFASHLEKSLRPAFRKLVKAIEQEERA